MVGRREIYFARSRFGLIGYSASMDEIWRELKIDFVLASLGGKTTITCFRKPVVVEIPPVTYSGALTSSPP